MKIKSMFVIIVVEFTIGFDVDRSRDWKMEFRRRWWRSMMMFSKRRPMFRDNREGDFTWKNLDENWDVHGNHLRIRNNIDMYHREKHLPVHVRISYEFWIHWCLRRRNHIDHIDEQVENEVPIVFVLKRKRNSVGKSTHRHHPINDRYRLLRPLDGGVALERRLGVDLVGIDLSDFASQSLKKITHWPIISSFFFLISYLLSFR